MHTFLNNFYHKKGHPKKWNGLSRLCYKNLC